jgi:hypothetical protein
MVDNSQDQGFNDEDNDIDEEEYDYPAELQGNEAA